MTALPDDAEVTTPGGATVTSDVLEGRELDEAVARMMPEWEAYEPPEWLWAGQVPPTGLWFVSRGKWVDTFQTPDAFHNIVLPWVREQGWAYSLLWNTRGEHAVLLWRDDNQPFLTDHPDLITAFYNALVRAWEGVRE